MKDEISLKIIQSISDSQHDLIVIFKENTPILINKAFKKFFAVSSLDDYKEEFGPFVHNFVPHPSYFHSEKIAKGSSWVDAILEIEESERIVSMMTPVYEPHAFLVKLRKIEEYVIAVFEDITQTLIKRIMIENNASIDQQSGAYAKNYFLHIAQSYQDAASFNKKLISAVLIIVEKKDEVLLRAVAQSLKGVIRQDDMLIRWDDNAFVVLYLVDSTVNAEVMLEKIRSLLQKEENADVAWQLKHFMQKESEQIKDFALRIE